MDHAQAENASPSAAYSLFPRVLVALIEAGKVEIDPYIHAAILRGISKSIEAVGAAWAGSDLSHFQTVSNYCISVIEDILARRKQRSEKMQSEGQFDEEDLQLLHEENAQESDLILEVCGTYSRISLEPFHLLSSSDLLFGTSLESYQQRP